MQKKIIALAVAAALAPAAAMADTTVYGRIHVSVDSISGFNTSKTNSSVNSNSSRFGVKGSEDLGSGLKAVYQLESGINAINNNNGVGGANDGNPGGGAPGNSLFTGMRTSYLGLAGDFGTFLVGRLPAGEQYVYDSNLFADQVGDAANILASGNSGIAGVSNYIGGRANSALHYITPNFSGFDAALTYLPAASVDATTGLSVATTSSASWGVKANYAAMGAAVHVAYFNVKAGTPIPATYANFTPLSIAGSYDFGPGMVTAQYVRNKISVTAVTPDVTQNMYNIGGTFKVMPNGTVKAQYSKAADSTNNNDGGSQIAIGFDYDLSKRTGVYVAFAQTNNNAGGMLFVPNGYGHGNNNAFNVTPFNNGDDPKAISVGLTHNF